MFSLFKKKQTIESSGILNGFIDYHSHILPGVDDGVQNIDETLRILNEYEKLGISEVWCTPHIMEDIPNTTKKLREQFAHLLENYDGTIKLHLAAEYMLDGLFNERLASDDLLLFGNMKNEILVETSYYSSSYNFNKVLDLIMSKGIFPVLAHPERYMYMDEKKYVDLKQKNIRFQLNLGSLGAAYGYTSYKKSLMLMKKGFYNYAGTDLHTIHFLDFIKSVKYPKGWNIKTI